jgi:nucleoid-associated protein YgaU
MTLEANVLPCPICGYRNKLEAKACAKCEADLSSFSKLYFLPTYYYNQGVEHAKNGNWHEAVKNLQVSLSLNPVDIDALVLLGKAYAMKGDYQSAMECWQQVLGINHNHVEARQCIEKIRDILDGIPEPSAIQKQIHPAELTDISSCMQELRKIQEEQFSQLKEIARHVQVKEKQVSMGGIEKILEGEIVEARNQWKRFVIGAITLTSIVLISAALLLQITLRRHNRELMRIENHISAINDSLVHLSQKSIEGNLPSGTLKKVQDLLNSDSRVSWLGLSAKQKDNYIFLEGEVCTTWLKLLVVKLVRDIEGIDSVDCREVRVIPLYEVKLADSFWRIAAKVYGDGNQWEKIYKANENHILKPDIIESDITLLIPDS